MTRERWIWERWQERTARNAWQKESKREQTLERHTPDLLVLKKIHAEDTRAEALLHQT
jgi:hypothetical protein